MPEIAAETLTAASRSRRTSGNVFGSAPLLHSGKKTSKLITCLQTWTLKKKRQNTFGHWFLLGLVLCCVPLCFWSDLWVHWSFSLNAQEFGSVAGVTLTISGMSFLFWRKDCDWNILPVDMFHKHLLYIVSHLQYIYIYRYIDPPSNLGGWLVGWCSIGTQPFFPTKSTFGPTKWQDIKIPRPRISTVQSSRDHQISIKNWEIRASVKCLVESWNHLVAHAMLWKTSLKRHHVQIPKSI